MDPTTTLFTFMLQTSPTVQSVHLFGSWDNFSTSYKMDRDIRRDRGQWRGCYSFKDIVCDDNNGAGSGSKRNGGLKMGSTYYYYYELDASHETHDPSLPSTTHCPFLPGQSVNTLEVPMEQTLRKRSASLTSIRNAEYRTMNPEDKFITPKPASQLSESPGSRSISSSPMPDSTSSSSSRPISPAPAWRRLFRKRSSSRGSSRSRSNESMDRAVSPDAPVDDTGSIASSQGSRSRNISPESLRRFLIEDGPTTTPAATSVIEERPPLSIPEDIAEENEDDDNFATSATSENNPYATLLSPPPFKRCHSNGSMPTVTNGSQMTLTQLPASTTSDQDGSRPTTTHNDTHAETGVTQDEQHSSFSLSSASSVISSTEPLADDEALTFYDSCDDDDDDEPFSPSGASAFQQLSSPREYSREPTMAPFSGYSLPQAPELNTKKGVETVNTVGLPALLTRSDETAVPMDNTALLAAPSDHGIDDFVNEMSWMVDVIRGKDSRI